MKASLKNIERTNLLPEVVLEHKDEVLIFSVSYFGRPAFSKGFDIFEQINSYWSSLSSSELDNIFNIYKDIRYMFNTYLDINTLSIHLKNKVNELIWCLNFDDIRQKIIFNSNINIPLSFEERYIQSNDRQKTREQTYLRSDYIDLVTLCIFFRTLIPIWGEYILRTKEKSGKTYKEYSAFKLLSESRIMDTDVMNKLKVYIELNTQIGKISANRLIEGVSVMDFTEWLLSVICVKVISVGDIRGLDTHSHLVSYIFQYIQQRTDSNISDPGHIIKIKEEPRENDDDRRTSTIEYHRFTMNISMGEIAELEASIENVKKCAYALTANMSDEILENALETSSMLINYKIEDPQIRLLQWIYAPLISPKAILYLNKSTIVKALGVTQAVLWARNHKYLSFYATAYSQITESSDDLILSTMESRSRIPKTTLDKLDLIYPYQVKNNNRRIPKKLINHSVSAIENLLSKISQSSWIATCDDKLLTQVLGHDYGKRIPVLNDFRVYLSDLVVELGEKSWI